MENLLTRRTLLVVLYLSVVFGIGLGCNRYDTRPDPELPARFEADLEVMNSKDVSGSATITKTALTLVVRMDVQGLLPDTTYAPNLMSASCAATGASAGGLHSGAPPRTDANGHLAYTDTVTISPSPLNRLTVAVWGPGDQLAACGPLRPIQE